MATLTFGAKIRDSCQYYCETDNCSRNPEAPSGRKRRGTVLLLPPALQSSARISSRKRSLSISPADRIGASQVRQCCALPLPRQATYDRDDCGSPAATSSSANYWHVNGTLDPWPAWNDQRWGSGAPRDLGFRAGAGDGNRTRTVSLGT